MNIKYNYEFAKNVFQNAGYELLSTSYKNVDTKLTFKDNDNYIYEMNFYAFYITKNKPQKFHPKNSHTIHNINLMLRDRKLNMTIVDEIYKSSHQLITLLDEDGYYYQTTVGGLLVGKSPRIFDVRNSYTLQNIRLWLSKNKPELALVSDKYENFNSKLIFKDSDGYKYEVSIPNLMKINFPNRIDPNHKFSIENIKLWLKLNNRPIELLSTEYVRNDSKLKCKCLKQGCGETFETIWSCIYIFAGCPYCLGKRVCASNCLANINPEVANQWHPTKNGDLTPYDVTCGTGKKAWWLCEKCGFEWSASICHRTSVCPTGCPICAASKGEVRTLRFFEFYNIKNEPQKEYYGLLGVGGRNLSYDFYLPDYNLLVEYQGEFHDGSAGKGNYHMMKNLKTQQEHDRRKREYAQIHNIKLLEIWYWDFNNIEEILTKELNISS